MIFSLKCIVIKYLIIILKSINSNIKKNKTAIKKLSMLALVALTSSVLTMLCSELDDYKKMKCKNTKKSERGSFRQNQAQKCILIKGSTSDRTK